MASEVDRSYQRTLIDQANAEMGRQRMSRRELARVTGIHRNTLDRLFLCERDLNVTQWDAIATALGFDPGELARKAASEAGDRPRPPSGGDERQTILWLMAHPEDDGVLQTRLGDLRRESGSTGSALAAVEREMRLNRRTELERALAEVPPAQAN
jgi:hypothetical protein